MHIGLVGVTGYSGKVLYQLLRQHPKIEQIDLYGHEATTVRSALPEYMHVAAKLLPLDPKTVMAQDDAIFFATPAGVTSQLAQSFIEQNFPVIDLSGDYRLKDPEQYERWYHKPAADQALLKKVSYGLSEFTTDLTNYVANPGCYATATLLALAPLVQQDLIQLDSIIVDAKSGVTGSGKKATPTTHFVNVNENLQMYKINQHQHIPEIMQVLKNWNPQAQPIQFNTTLIPIDRGIMATVYAKVKTESTQADLQAAYQKIYQDKPFVQVLTESLPDIRSVVGTNNCNLGVTYNAATHTVMVISVIDNLLKGAAGQAVQNFNKLFHFEETTALPKQALGF